jgi:hypothetical protein
LSLLVFIGDVVICPCVHGSIAFVLWQEIDVGPHGRNVTIKINAIKRLSYIARCE